MPAKVEKLSKNMIMPAMEDMPTRLTINLKKYPGFEYKDVGDKCEGIFEGVVTSVNKNRDFEEISLEIKKLKSNSAKKSNQGGNEDDGEDE